MTMTMMNVEAVRMSVRRRVVRVGMRVVDGRTRPIAIIVFVIVMRVVV